MLIIYSKHEGALSALRCLNSEALYGVTELCFGTRLFALEALSSNQDYQWVKTN